MVAPVNKKYRTATFGAGCFWGVEELYRTLKGVIDTKVGYMGGTTKNPSYEDVCSNETGHAEVVHITYDPALVSYEELLTIFWENHNPTTLNRQGWDVGTQYRSVIFYYSDEQKKIAEKSKGAIANEGKWKGKNIVTQIVPAQPFYPAEEYHQKYLFKKGAKSCHI